MALKLSHAKREELFQTYVKERTILGVARTCGVSHTTARKYCREDGWRARIARIEQAAEKKTDKALVRHTAQNIKIVRGFLIRVAKMLSLDDKAFAKAFVTRSTAADIDKFIRLEEFLLGQPDSRPDVAGLRKMSDEELLGLLSQLQGSNAGDDL